MKWESFILFLPIEVIKYWFVEMVDVASNIWNKLDLCTVLVDLHAKFWVFSSYNSGDLFVQTDGKIEWLGSIDLFKNIPSRNDSLCLFWTFALVKLALSYSFLMGEGYINTNNANNIIIISEDIVINVNNSCGFLYYFFFYLFY